MAFIAVAVASTEGLLLACDKVPGQNMMRGLNTNMLLNWQRWPVMLQGNVILAHHSVPLLCGAESLAWHTHGCAFEDVSEDKRV